MTGSEHYVEAEKLLSFAGDDHEAQVELFAGAQVHATLALAAAVLELSDGEAQRMGER